MYKRRKRLNLSQTLVRARHFVAMHRGESFLVIKTTGGLEQKISWSYISQVDPVKRSMMLYLEPLALNQAQDFADLVEYLKTLN